MLSLFEQFNEIEVSTQGKSNEWYTPARYVDAARKVMGGIDLDPASCEIANRTVKAVRYYTKKDNGLIQPWYGRVWLNPPFGRMNASKNTAHGSTGGKSIMGLFVTKLLNEYSIGNTEQAILLATNKADTSWFDQLWSYPICFTRNRVLFDRPDTHDREGHFFGTVFVYLGPYESAFIEHFSQFGRIAKAIDTPKPKPTMRSLWE